MNIREIVKKYDRAVVSVLTAIGILLATYMSIGGKIDSLIAQSPCMQRMEAKINLNEKLQEQTNKFVSDKLDSIDRKIDRLLRK